ncbi:MAG: histidine phosphatase family protein, partial [Thermoplasmata archaeon]
MSENFLFLVRHGKTIMNSQNKWQGFTDSPLTEEGINQIKKTAERLKNEGIKGIYSSRIQRAKTSASIISSITAIPVMGECDGLNERNLGKIETLTS